MSEWQKSTVAEVASGFLSGGTPSTSRADFWEGEIPWITSKWLGDKLELTTGEKFVSEEAVKKTATKIVPKDSIIFATRVGVGGEGALTCIQGLKLGRHTKCGKPAMLFHSGPVRPLSTRWSPAAGM